MSKPAPIVAELGRPETPEETAARKAESSRAYRSSQTARSLVAALLVSVAGVAIVYFAVPRGEPAATPSVDVAGIAANVESTVGSTVLIPEVEEDWRANAAELQSGATVVWDIVLAPQAEDQTGFIHVAQAFDADVSWAPQPLGGTASSGTVDVAGRTWDEFTLRNAEENKNISYALGTQAGDDYIFLYGHLSTQETADLAASLESQIETIEEQR